MLSIFNRKQKSNLVYNQDTVGCIGKLPIYNEFLKYNLATPALAALDQSYQQAFNLLSQRYGTRVKELFAVMPVHDFFYYSNSEANPVIGSVFASSDKSGRVYPFVGFRVVANPLTQEFYTLIPTSYRHYFTALHTVVDTNAINGGLAEVYHNLEQTKQMVSSITKHTILEYSVELLGKFSFGSCSFDFNQESVLSLLRQLKTDKSRSYSLRLPLADSGAFHASIIFWLQLIQYALTEKAVRLQAFWNRPGPHHKPALTIFIQAMPTDFLIQLADRDLEHNYLFDITRASKPAIGSGATTSSDDLSLLDVLKRWSAHDF